MGGGMSIEMWRAEDDDVALHSDLQRRVFEEFQWEAALDPCDVAVDVTDRTVTLTGLVKSYPQKIAAERAAKRVHGAQVVNNLLRVVLPTDDVRSDWGLARAVLRALRSDVLVPRDAFRITVRDGRVRLEGEVPSDAARRAAEDVVSCLVGVTEIANLVTVHPPVPPTGDVKERVEAALERAPELRGDHIKVDVEDETVALRGRVRSLSERDEAERAARMVPGVSRIRDDLKVGRKS